MQQTKQQQIQQIRQWIKHSGCLIHPGIQIPAYYNGIQGIGTKQSLPHKTLIIAIPSKLVITVTRCYNDPELKSLFKSNDDLFDYQASEDAQFNILCVFLMYHKLNIGKSPWRVYLNTIAEPQTGVSWPDKDLAGLNKSAIQQILHVRQQCKKIQLKLCTVLANSQQFKKLSYPKIVQLFRICYPTVLTRCFGYYFSTACMIPIADLMNHGCQAVNHQLIHLNFQKQKQFYQEYNSKRHNINCQIMGLQKPIKQSMPFRLQYLLKNQLIENDLQILSKLNRKGIDQKIHNFLQDKIKNDKHQIEAIDFCQEDDKQDNDTDQDQQYGQTKSLEYIKAAEKQQMIQFQKYYLQVQKLGVVQQKIKDKFGNQALDQDTIPQDLTKIAHKTTQNNQEKQINKQKQNISVNQSNTAKQEQILQKQIKTEQTENLKKQLNQTPKTIPTQNSNSKSSNSSNKLFPNQNMCPVHIAQPSSSQSSCSQQQQWCLDQTCYFTMSTYTPVQAGVQLFNSYGSRTNKFLLVWYGFTYRDNLYDSVTLRLQANFPQEKPKVKDIILDTYVGGQGLCFKKNQQQFVQANQVSRQFRLKRSRLPLDFFMFLRLLLTMYYQGSDNYKLLSTIPSSLNFQMILLTFFKQIVEHLYERYPLKIIEALKQQYIKQSDNGRKSRISFKIIYLQQQRKILDANMQAVQSAIQIIKRLQKQNKFTKQIYSDMKIQTIRKIRQYILDIKSNFSYILYSQEQNFENKEEGKN